MSAWDDELNDMNRDCEEAFGVPCVLHSPAGIAYPFTGVYTSAAKDKTIAPASRTTMVTMPTTLRFSRADVAVDPEQGWMVDVVLNLGGTVRTVTHEISAPPDPEGTLAWLLTLREVPA